MAVAAVTQNTALTDIVDYLETKLPATGKIFKSFLAVQTLIDNVSRFSDRICVEEQF